MATSKTKLDIGLVRELAAILREADLGELEVEHEGLRIRVCKPAPPVMHAPAAPPPGAMSAPALATLSGPGASAVATDTVPANAVRSPMVGTVYLSADPQSEPYISIGTKVKIGDVLMLIEAMKTYNSVEADRAGTVKAIYVSNAQPVEYGEPLVLIE